MLKVKKVIVVLITGILWIIVSILLFKRAIEWTPEFTNNQLIIAILGAIVLCFIKTKFVFIKVTKKNIQRIMNYENDKISVFAFHTLKFYILILLMIGTGMLLRNSEFIPKYTIFPIYAGVGFAMFFTSFMNIIYYLKHK